MPSYLPTPYCAPDALSRALWLLSRPVEVQQPGDTETLFSVVETLDNSGYLLVDDEHMLNIHAKALPDGNLPPPLRKVFAGYVTAGALPATAENAFRSKIADNLGRRVMASFLLPDELLPTLKSHAQLIAAGILPQPSLP